MDYKNQILLMRRQPKAAVTKRIWVIKKSTSSFDILGKTKSCLTKEVRHDNLISHAKDEEEEPSKKRLIRVLFQKYPHEEAWTEVRIIPSE